MIRLPIFTSMRVENYGLFPGSKKEEGINWRFEPGLCLIAGVNGLGKTTFVTMLLRALTGPFDLTGDGLPDKLESVVPENPVLLRPRHVQFFAQRVADAAKHATVELGARFAKDEVLIRRQLSDLRLLSFHLNGVEKDLGANREDREAEFQQQMCRLFALSSFVDVLLILHHVVFFKEDRPGALWDENAQRHVLRALFLDKGLAAQVAAMERRVESADSQARNISAAAYSTKQRLQQARASVVDASEKSVELSTEQALLDAELAEGERLDALLGDLDENRRSARREYERSKLFREEAERAVESLKFAAMARLFPGMNDAVRLLLLKLMDTGECLVCGADSTERVKRIEAQLADGLCPVCGSQPDQQDHIVPAFKVENKRVAQAREVAELSKEADESTRTTFEEAVAKYDSVLNQLVTLRTSIQERTLRTKQLRAQLPFEAGEITALEKALEIAVRSQRQAESERASAAKQLNGLLEGGRTSIEGQTKKLAKAFKFNVKEMIAEDAELVRIVGRAKITQGGSESFTVPAFKAEMSAANIPGRTTRYTPDDVSESQRELIDLAFRLALIDVATGSAASTLMMETPEASLDELAMDRVGSTLHRFAAAGENRLVVTSNLTNAGMITAMFGGPARRTTEVTTRQAHVLNLLDVAAPNQAVLKDRASYERILKAALSGGK